MHRIIIGLLIFVAGWGFGWYTHNYQGTDRIQFTQSEISVPSSTFDKPAASVTPQAPVLEDNMANMLMHNDFDAALNHYESLQVQADDMAASKARTQILSYANSLIEDHRFGLAEKLLQRFLVTAHRDVDARILLAAAYYGQKDFKVTIDQLYEAKGYAYRQDMQQRIIRRIRSVVAEQMQLLKRNNDQGALLAFFQHLTQLEPSHASYFIELATAQLALDNKEAARISLQLVLYDSDVGPQARAMLSELNLALARLQDADSPVSVEDVVGIPLHRSGNSFLVDARSADGQSIRLLIDTGASMTILTPDVLDQRGIRYQDTGRTGTFNTANGRVQAPVYKLDSLSVGEWQVNNIEVGVLSLGSSSNVDGLLGMNFLNKFQFFIDQNESLLRLTAN